MVGAENGKIWEDDQIDQVVSTLDQSALISITNRDGNIIYANQVFCDISGYAQEELIGQNHRILKSGLQPDGLFVGMWAAISKGRVWRGEICNKAKDGSHYWVYATINPVTDKQGRIEKYVAVRFDITDAKKNEKLLKESNLRYQLVAKATNDVIWDWDLETNQMFRGANYAIEFNRSDEHLNTFWDKLIYTDDLDRVDKELRDALNNPKVLYWESDYRLKKLDGGYAYVHDRAYIVRKKDGKAIRMTGAMRDVTLSKMKEWVREKMASDILEKNKHLEQFAYIVSHNLRAPLANIMGLVGLINQTSSEHIDPELEKLLTGLRVSAEKTDGIIKDLNTVLSMESESNHAREPVNLSELIEDIKIDLKVMMEESEAVIVCNFDDEPEITGIRGYLYSVIHNLVTNAIKYRREDLVPQIQFQSKRVQGDIHLLCKDNGLGMDLGEDKDPFQLYTRFHTHKDGKGVGLFMVKKQMEQMNGTITVESELNKGSLFTMEFRNQEKRSK